jgi:hypothetical protein
MALGFLSSGGGDGGGVGRHSGSGGGGFSLDGLAGGLSGIGSLMNAFGMGKPKPNYGPSEAERQTSSLLMALLDPNNSLVKQNTDINMQRGMQDMLMQLKQIQMQNARGQARGIRPFLFSPERSDETMDFLMTRGQPAIAERARDRATTDIRNTAQGFAGLIPVQQQRINDKNSNDSTDYARFQTAGGYSQIGGGLQELLNMLSPAKSNIQSGYR